MTTNTHNVTIQHLEHRKGYLIDCSVPGCLHTYEPTLKEARLVAHLHLISLLSEPLEQVG